ncbi:hypothetical protein BKA70DRAFT_836260, partial [Coprinopsis sp. MPI-PUGE-AT-0042]
LIRLFLFNHNNDLINPTLTLPSFICTPFFAFNPLGIASTPFTPFSNSLSMTNVAGYSFDSDVLMQPSTPNQQATFAENLSASMTGPQEVKPWDLHNSGSYRNPFLDPSPAPYATESTATPPLTSSTPTAPNTHRFTQHPTHDPYPSFTASLSSTNIQSPKRRANTKRHISHRQATAIIHSPRSHRHVSPVSLKRKKRSIYNTPRGSGATIGSPIRAKKRTSSNPKALSLGTLCKMPLRIVRKGIKGTVGVAKSVGNGTVEVAEGVGRALRFSHRRILDFDDEEGQEILMESEGVGDDDDMDSPMPLSPLAQLNLSAFESSANDIATPSSSQEFNSSIGFPIHARPSESTSLSADAEMVEHEANGSVVNLPVSPGRTYRSACSSPNASISSSFHNARSRSKAMRILGAEAYTATLETQRNTRRRTKSLWA